MAAAIYRTKADERIRQRPSRTMPTILVVDDESSVLHMVSDILQDEEMRVLTAESGQEALDLAKHEQPDLIITDLMMPGINGRVLCQHLRSLPELSKTPVLLMTAAYQVQALGDFAGIIPKPFDIDDLLSQVYRYLDAS